MTTDKAFGNLIYSYTRAQAIEDGVLIDITADAQAHGFKVHTVVTDNLYHRYVEVPSGLDRSFGQSSAGRLHDLLILAMIAARNSKGTNRAYFTISFLMAPGRSETVQVIAHIGPGDTAEPVLTLMLPEDD